MPMTAARTRNREATRKRLIDAIGALMARDGLKALGVNAVAREAGVDKVLIYRYFGGLRGLTAAFAREGDFWPSPEELAGGDPAAFQAMPAPLKLSRLAETFLDAIRRRPLTQEIMAWEMVESNELTAELDRVREATILDFFDSHIPELAGRTDIRAVAAIIGAGLSYLVTRARHVQHYTGIDLRSETGWRQLLLAVDAIVAGLFDPSSNQGVAR